MKKTSLPSIEDARIIAVSMSNKLDMTSEQQAYFVAGFQECIKVLQEIQKGLKKKYGINEEE